MREARHVDRGAAIKIEEVRFGSLPEKAKRTPPRCSKPSEADLELKAGSVHVKGAPSMLQSHGELVDANETAFRASRWRRGLCRARGCSELTVDRGPRVRIPSLRRRVMSLDADGRKTSPLQSPPIASSSTRRQDSLAERAVAHLRGRSGRLTGAKS